MSVSADAPCPICFEMPTYWWPTQKAHYEAVHNHSWENRNRCDAHGVCWACLAKHIEVQVLSEGKCNVRCPGEGCHYHLLLDDVRYALWGSPTGGRVLDTLAHLSSQSCQDRLKDMVFDTLGDESGHWVLQECQPCPQCFVLARRETGCNHIVCRCGCDFCFSCGAPNHGHEEAGCICEYLDHQTMDGQVFFAAWLRSANASPCAWLREPELVGESPRFVTTIGFWLWFAGAGVSPPASWHGNEKVANQTALPPLKWTSGTTSFESRDESYDYYDDFFHYSSEPLEQDLAGHLKKEAYSLSSHRNLRRDLQRKWMPSTEDSEPDKCCASKSLMRLARPRYSKIAKRSRDSQDMS